MPLVVALVIGGAAAGALALAAAAAAAFLAHEPLLVLLGQRGGRASRDQNADARRSLFRSLSRSGGVGDVRAGEDDGWRGGDCVGADLGLVSRGDDRPRF